MARRNSGSSRWPLSPAPIRRTGAGRVVRTPAVRDTHLHRLARVQQRGGVAALIDCNATTTVDAMRRAGVRPHELLVSQPDNRRQAHEIADTLRRSGAVDVIVTAGCGRPRAGR